MSNQRGNILFLILLAVVLFAALSYAVTSSMRGGGKDVSDEKARSLASTIINYGGQLENTINRLMLMNNCTIGQLSFESSALTPLYNNLNSPESKKCHLYEPEGGGLSWQNPPVGASLNANTVYHISGRNYVWHLGLSNANDNDSSDLMLILPNVGLKLCQTLNAMLDVENPNGMPPVTVNGNATSSSGAFNGTPLSYRADSTFGGQNALRTPAMIGKKAACFTPNTVNGVNRSNQYWFYYVILER